jgi:DNA polymerase
MGIPVWVMRGDETASSRDDESAAPAAAASAAILGQGVAPKVAPTRTAADVAGLDWEALAQMVRPCTRCGLHATRTQTVFGVGRRDAALMIIGEAPGQEEDRQGEPFVGPAGQLLNAMLKAIKFRREDVYIANILKCRPPHNRDPSPEEAATCTPYLNRQIELLRPRVMLAVGRIAGQWLLQSELPIGRLRGQVSRYGETGIPLVVTYHPAYLLRSPLAKAKAWQDLCLVRDLVESHR